MQKELTTSQAVRAYRVHPITVLRLILTGKLEAKKDQNGRWLIRKDSLDRWNRRRRVRKGSKLEEIGATATA